jgi:hypothetical protein
MALAEPFRAHHEPAAAAVLHEPLEAGQRLLLWQPDMECRRFERTVEEGCSERAAISYHGRECSEEAVAGQDEKLRRFAGFAAG